MLSRAETARIVALQRRRTRERERLFIAEGVRVVEELLQSPVVLRYIVTSPSVGDTERGRALLALARAATTVHEITDAEFNRIAGTDAPQGILAVAEMAVRRLEDVALEDRALVLVLDGVQDPGNLGTLVRAADAFSVRAVIALPGTVDTWNPKVVRSAAGSLFRVPVVHTSVAAAQTWLAQNGMRVLAADAAGTPVEQLPIAARTALIVGSEGAGLSAQARALADAAVAIPMPGSAESLNVAVAAGILLYALTRGNA